MRNIGNPCLGKDIWKYREMMFNLVKSDLNNRYKGSVMGFFWMLISPLLQMGVYTFVFSVIIKMNIERFYLYLFVALIPWIFFSSCLSAGANAVISQQDLIKRVCFPREIIPVSFTISQFINMALSFLVVLLVALLSGVSVSIGAVFMLFVVMAVQFILAVGIVLMVSAFAVFFRDLPHILSIASMMWMYLTPVLYPVEFVPDDLKKLLYLNPMTPIIIAYRDILYYGRIPDLSDLAYALGFSMMLLIVGEGIFARLKRRFAEEL